MMTTHTYNDNGPETAKLRDQKAILESVLYAPSRRDILLYRKLCKMSTLDNTKPANQSEIIHGLSRHLIYEYKMYIYVCYNSAFN